MINYNKNEMHETYLAFSSLVIGPCEDTRVRRRLNIKITKIVEYFQLGR
jgi:hypothetical protein